MEYGVTSHREDFISERISQANSSKTPQ